MNRNHITIVKENDFNKPLNHKIDSIIDNCNRKVFIQLKKKCVYDIKLTNISDNEITN